MSLKNDLQNIYNVKNDIKNAIINQGQTVTDDFTTYSNAISNISSTPDGIFIQETQPTKTTSEAIWLKKLNNTKASTKIDVSTTGSAWHTRNTTVSGGSSANWTWGDMLNLLTSEQIAQFDSYSKHIIVRWVSSYSETLFLISSNNMIKVNSGITTSSETLVVTFYNQFNGGTKYISDIKTVTNADYNNYSKVFVWDDIYTSSGSIGYTSDIPTTPEDGIKIDVDSNTSYTIHTNKSSSWNKILDTSDATATASDILTGKTAYKNNTKITGTMNNLGDLNIIPNTSGGTISSGFVNSINILAVNASIDPNITASNIANGVNILGIIGNFEGGTSVNFGNLDITPSTSAQSFVPSSPIDGYNIVNVAAVDNASIVNMDHNLTSGNIANGVEIFGITGAFVGGDINLEEYFNYPNNQQTEQTPFKLSSDLYKSLPYNITENSKSLSNAFYTLENTQRLYDLDCTNVTKISSMLSGCRNLQILTGSGKMKFSNNLTMNGTGYIIESCPNLTDITPLGNWDISNVTNFGKVINYCQNLADISPLANWDISNVTDLYTIWDYYCKNILNIDAIKNWDVSNVRNIHGALFGTDSLLYSNTSALSALNNWNWYSLISINNMFLSVPNNADMSVMTRWNYPNVKTMSKPYTYSGYSNWDINTLQNYTNVINNILTKSNVEELTYPFTNYANLVNSSTIGNITRLNVSKLKTMSGMFSGFTNTGMTSLSLSGWNVSNCVNFQNMFASMGRITDLSSISGWNMNNAENISGMFRGMSNLQNVQFMYNWDLSNVKDASYLFASTNNTLNLYGLTNANMNNVENLAGFLKASKVTNIAALSSINTSKVTNMAEALAMNGIVNIEPVRNWDTSNVTTFHNLFAPETSYIVGQSAKITNVNALANWDISNVTDMSGMFYKCQNLSDLSGIANWDMSNVKNISGMFTNCTNIASLQPLANWNTSNIESLSGFITECQKLTSLNGLENWDTSNVKSIYFGWYFTNVSDISAIRNWNISNAELIDIRYMSKVTDFSPISNWDLTNSKVKSLSTCFSLCNSMQNPQAVANWDVSKVEDMSWMFRLSSITSLNGLENWNTSSLKYINRFCESCSNLTDISAVANWDMSNVENFDDMFWGCSNITDFSPLGNWHLNINVNTFDKINPFSFSSSSSINFEWLNGWTRSGKVDFYGNYHNLYESKFENGVFPNTDQMTNNTLNAIVKFYANINVQNYYIYKSEWGWGSETTNIQATFGMYNVTDYTSQFTNCNVGLGLSNNCLERIIAMNTADYQRALNNGWLFNSGFKEIRDDYYY